jgi:acetylornithine deacetylase/succinyl-diaminopimelate desuccinylase-like protein
MRSAQALLIPAMVGALVLGAAVSSRAADAGAAPDKAVGAAESLRDQALAGASPGYDFLRELTTRFGPRPAGSEREQAAAAWAAARLKAMGFANVQVQSFPVTGWVRGPEHAEITAPTRQNLAAAALGEAPPTPAGGIEAPIVVFASLEDLAAVPDGSLAGKIVFVNRPMVRMQDGSGYGPISRIRTRGPLVAAKKGAVAFLLRSAGTDNHRLPHTGTTLYENGKAPLPAFALSIPDADQLARLAALGPVRVNLFSGASYRPDTHSQNVIAEIPGREHPEEVVLLGAHMDSWDLGTGAIDDGAGDAIILGAADLIRRLPQAPRRTIRIVFYGSEEVAQPNAPFGAFGGEAYLAAHKADVTKHIAAGESDFGADRVYGLAAARVLIPLGVLVSEGVPDGGEDVGPTIQAGAPGFDLLQDGTRYFDIHHTADDTFDKVDPVQFNQNVAAWAAVVWLLADTDVDLRAAMKAAKP